MKFYQVVRSKIKKTGVLQADSFLSNFIPETLLYNYNNLTEMLNRHPLIFVKPDRGRKGFKVAAVKKHNGNYLIFYNSTLILYTSVKEVDSFVKELSGHRKFLIQQGIDVLKVKGRPFSVRVWVQKPYEKWEVTCLTAAAAPPHSLITNYHQGGSLLPFKEAMIKADVMINDFKKIRNLLYAVGEHTAAVLNEKFTGLRELGIDAGIDQSFYPWIFEVNTKPMIIVGNERLRLNHKIIIESLNS